MYNNWTRARAEEFFGRWVAEEPARRARLHELAAVTGGPSLEPTIDGLVAVNAWYLEQARLAKDDPSPGRPEWVQSTNPAISAAFWRLTELIAQHLADVLRAEEPDGRWVCFKNGDRRDDRNGKPMLDLGWPRNPADVFLMANGTVPIALYYDGRFEVTDLKRVVENHLRQLAEHRAGIWA